MKHHSKLFTLKEGAAHLQRELYKNIFSCTALHFGIPFFIQRTLGHNYFTPLSQCFRTDLGEVNTSYIQRPNHLSKSRSKVYTQDKPNSIVNSTEPAFLTAKSRTHILFRSRSGTPLHKQSHCLFSNID